MLTSASRGHGVGERECQASSESQKSGDGVQSASDPAEWRWTVELCVGLTCVKEKRIIEGTFPWGSLAKDTTDIFTFLALVRLCLLNMKQQPTSYWENMLSYLLVVEVQQEEWNSCSQPLQWMSGDYPEFSASPKAARVTSKKRYDACLVNHSEQFL